MVSNFNFNSTFFGGMSSRQKQKKHLSDSRKKLRKRSGNIVIRDLSFARPLRFVLIFCPCACLVATALLNGHGACAQCRWVFTSKGDTGECKTPNEAKIRNMRFETTFQCQKLKNPCGFRV